MLENVKCGSHQKNGMSLGPENTKSDILKRTSKLARQPPPPCLHFSAFQVPPSPPLVRTSFMNGPFHYFAEAYQTLRNLNCLSLNSRA